MPKRHKDRMSISEDGDNFMCHACQKEQEREREREQHIEMTQDDDYDTKSELHGLHHRLKFRPHRTRSAATDCGLCPLRNVTF